MISLPKKTKVKKEVKVIQEIRQLTPSDIVEELDKYIIGQQNAKKSVAIALRNRWRRQQVGDKMKDEIMPNNIIMIGPTGVGKTEMMSSLLVGILPGFAFYAFGILSFAVIRRIHVYATILKRTRTSSKIWPAIRSIQKP